MFFVGEIRTSNGVSLPNDGKVWRLDKVANVWTQIVPGGPPGDRHSKLCLFSLIPTAQK